MIQHTIQALAEPTRREILALVGERELASSAIAAHFHISAPAVSQHLKVLADCGLVSMRRDGTRRYYRLRREGLADIKAFVDRFWDDSLARLKEAAEEEQRKQDGANT
jgi:DNA-binding transcriptional ArsR family regulator